MATKRNSEALQAEGVKKTKTGEEGVEISEETVIEQRVLIDNAEAGIIIGKGGSNVKRIRTESGAFLSILKNESQTKERVMVLKGVVDNIAKAFSLIISLLIEASTERAQKNDPTATGPESVPMTLLIHKFLAGSVIGQGGAIIKSIMADTGARVQLSNEPLANSTEKTVTVSGAPEAAVAGLVRVMNQVRDNPLKPNSSSMLYVPGAAMMYGNPYGAAPAYAPAPPQQQMYAQPYGAAPAYGAPQSYGAPAAAPAAAAAGGAGNKTEKIVIPTVCAGSVIGKGGSIIRDIKNQSGCFVSIADPEPTAPNDRVVSVTGSAQGIQTAIFLIRQRVEAYQPPGMAPGMSLPAMGSMPPSMY